ncbi:hypothetical protein ACFY9S_38610 [Streptomyces sp. NPDC012474]|uniref:RraA family protein n=1 Tax=Streptomyces sp. NPDC012474 TaxID=3364836 RepID=UPI0036F01018
MANVPVQPGPQPGTGDHPADAQDRPGPRPPPRPRPLVAAQGFQFEPRQPQVCEVHPRPAAGHHTHVRRRDQGDGLHERAGPHWSELTAMGSPACSPGVSAQGTVKAGPGPVNAPAVVAGTTVQRGDAIVADDDGVLCVPLLRRSHTLGHRRRDHGER